MLLASFPLTASMGNPVACWCRRSCSGQWPLPSSWADAGVCPPAVVLVVLEAGLALPGLRLPSSPFHASEPVLTTLKARRSSSQRGSAVLVPGGRCWEVPSGGASGSAGRISRSAVPADVAQAQMAGVAGVPLGAGAWKAQPERGAPLQVPDGFRSLLVLEDRLPARNRARLRAWLREEATLLAEDEALSAWQLPP